MVTLLRFAWRELRRAKARVALIALVLVIQTAALGGGMLAQESLYSTRDFWSNRLALADLEVRFVPAARDEMPSLDALRQIPGVRAVERRFVTPGTIERAGGAPLPVVIHYIDPERHPDVDDVALLNGHWLERGHPERAILDRSFAATERLAVGDRIVVNPHRFPTAFTVTGIGLSAEYLVPTANPELLVPHKGSLGVVYASREALDHTFSDELYDDLVFTFARSANRRATTEKILAALGGLEVERVVPKRATFAYRFLDVVLEGSRLVAPTIALVIALMATIVAFLSLHRLVAERRREIGCLLAQGFSPFQLASCIFGLGLVPGVLGGLAGVPAAILFADEVARTSASISGFPEPMMVWDAHSFALALAPAAGSAVIVGVLAAVPPSLEVLRLHPANALRATSEVRFTGLPRPIERLLAGRPSLRYAFRNVFRRLRLSGAAAALVALAVALPAGLLTSIASWNTWAKDEAAHLGWDAIATFKVPLATDHVEELIRDKGVASYSGYVQGYAPMRRGETAAEVRVRGIPLDDALIKLRLTAGRGFSHEDADEVILNTAFTGPDPVHVGEVVTLFRHGVPHRLLVVGTEAGAALSTVVVPRGTAQRIFGLEGKLSGVYLRFGDLPRANANASAATARPVAAPRERGNAEVLETLDIDDGPTAASAAARAPRVFRDTPSALLDEELVTSVEVRTRYADATLKYLSAFNVIVVPFVGLGGALAFFFLLSVLGFLLLERETEYATLRSLGYTTGEIARIVFAEVLVLAGAGLVLSLGTWVATACALRAPMARAWFWVPLDFRASDFLACGLPTLLFLVIAALPGIRALMRIDLAAALRGRALG